MDSQYTIWLIHAQFQSTAKESSQAKITITDCCIVPLYLSQFSAATILNNAMSLQSPLACVQQQGAKCTESEIAFYSISAKCCKPHFPTPSNTKRHNDSLTLKSSRENVLYCSCPIFFLSSSYLHPLHPSPNLEQQ